MPARIPLSMEEFFALPVGSTVIIKYNKDDNPAYQRLNGPCVITAKDGDTVYTDDYEWCRDEVPDFNDNQLDTSRGFAYFFKAENDK